MFISRRGGGGVEASRPAGLPIDLARGAPALLAASHWFDRAGSADGGMHVLLEGKDQSGRRVERQWFIVARDGDGRYIPCAPAVILAKRMLSGAPTPAAAMACVGVISLEDYLDELRFLRIKTCEFRSEPRSRSCEAEATDQAHSAVESGVATSSNGRRSALTANRAATTAAPSISAAAKT
jgi:hypothetical protein